MCMYVYVERLTLMFYLEIGSEKWIKAAVRKFYCNLFSREKGSHAAKERKGIFVKRPGGLILWLCSSRAEHIFPEIYE